MERKIRYSDEDLQEFKEFIEQKLSQAENDYEKLKEIYVNDKGNRINDTSPVIKPYADPSLDSSKEMNAQLASRQEKFIRDLKFALERIENKTYGICRETGNLIRKERLMSVPHATLSIDAKKNER